MVIGFSHFDGGRAATEHLIAVGYRRIGFVGARMDPRVQRRFLGYQQAMKDAGLTDPRLVVTTPLQPDLDGHVLMLEEVEEALYRIDRSLFHITSNAGIRIFSRNWLADWVRK